MSPLTRISLEMLRKKLESLTFQSSLDTLKSSTKCPVTSNSDAKFFQWQIRCLSLRLCDYTSLSHWLAHSSSQNCGLGHTRTCAFSFLCHQPMSTYLSQWIEHLIYAEVETVKGGMPRAPTLQTKGNGYHALLSLRSRLQTSLEVVSPLGPHLSIHVSLEIAKRVN